MSKSYLGIDVTWYVKSLLNHKIMALFMTKFISEIFVLFLKIKRALEISKSGRACKIPSKIKTIQQNLPSKQTNFCTVVRTEIKKNKKEKCTAIGNVSSIYSYLCAMHSFKAH